MGTKYRTLTKKAWDDIFKKAAKKHFFESRVTSIKCGLKQFLLCAQKIRHIFTVTERLFQMNASLQQS